MFSRYCSMPNSVSYFKAFGHNDVYPWYNFLFNVRIHSRSSRMNTIFITRHSTYLMKLSVM